MVDLVFPTIGIVRSGISNHFTTVPSPLRKGDTTSDNRVVGSNLAVRQQRFAFYVYFTYDVTESDVAKLPGLILCVRLRAQTHGGRRTHPAALERPLALVGPEREPASGDRTHGESEDLEPGR